MLTNITKIIKVYIGRQNFSYFFDKSSGKMVKRDLDKYVEDRYADLYRAYKEALATGRASTHEEAVRAAISSPSPGYRISTMQAYRQVNRMLHGLPPTYPPGSRKRAAIEQVFRLFLLLREKPLLRGASTYFIVSLAVSSPAPCAYVSFSTARKIIARIRKLKQDERNSQK